MSSGNVLMYLEMGLKVANGRIWCQESSDGQCWPHKRTPWPFCGCCAGRKRGDEDEERFAGCSASLAAGTGAWSSSGAGEEDLLVPPAAPPSAQTSPVTFTSTELTSEDDIIKSDGFENARCARSSCQVRRKKRGEAMLQEGVRDGACVSPSPAQCQTGSLHIDVIGKVHCRSMTAANKRGNIGLNDSTGKSNIHVFRGGKLKPELCQCKSGGIPALLPHQDRGSVYPICTAGAWLNNCKEKKRLPKI